VTNDRAADARRPVVTVSTVTKPDASAAGFWFYVEESQVLVSADDPDRTVATLSPGNWYQAHSEQSGWVWACDEHGTEGWIATTAIRRYE
jgi:hypothetical protein